MLDFNSSKPRQIKCYSGEKLKLEIYTGTPYTTFSNGVDDGTSTQCSYYRLMFNLFW